MTELHYRGVYLSLDGVTGRTAVSATGAVSRVKGIVGWVSAGRMSEREAAKFIRREMLIRGYGEPKEVYG